MRRLLVTTIFLAACGVPQELYNAQQRDLDRTKTELARTQSDYTASQRNADDLATESSDLRERIAALQADRAKSATAQQLQQQSYEAWRSATKLADQRAEVYEQIARYVQPLVDKKAVTLESLRGRLMLRMPESALFEANKADLKPDGQALLRELAAVLKQVNRDFLVACHADDQPLKDSPYKSAWELTLARAVAVVRFFQGEGVDPRHLGAAGYSQFSALTDNSDESARAQNRRVELIVMPTAEELVPLPKKTPPPKS